LTYDDIAQVQGSREELDGLLQKKYGYARDKAQAEIDAFLRENDFY